MENIRAIAKNTIFMSMLFGVYFFFTYVMEKRVPFPLDIDVLPSLLIMIGLLGFIFSIVGSLYVFMASLIAYDPYDINYYKYFYLSSFYCRNKYLSSIAGFILYFLVAPITLWLSLYLGNELLLSITWFVAIPFLYSFYLLTPNDRVSKSSLRVLFPAKYLVLVGSYFFVSLLSNFSFLIYVKFLAFTELVATDPEFYISSIVFVILSYISLIPRRPMNEFERIAKQRSESGFFSDFYKSPAVLICSLAVLFCLYPPVTAKIAHQTLYFLGLGGEVERVYYFTPSSRIRIPSEVIDSCTEEKYCQTKSLEVVLGVGGVLYVKVKNDNGNKLIGLPSKHMYPIISSVDSKQEN